MPKQSGVKVYSTFVKGLITEATALTYPENASSDEQNFLLNRDGSRQRRLGLDYEDGYTAVDTSMSATPFNGYAVEMYRWDNASGDSTVSIGVVQVGPKLWFMDLTTSAPSANLLNGGSALTIGVNGETPYQFSTVNGILIVATGETDPVYLEYDTGTDTISSNTITIEIRDLIGVDDGLDIDEHPATLSDTHDYNLKNQGWDSTKISDYENDSDTSGYPSNVDVWHLGKDSTGDFDPDVLIQQNMGNTPAAKGHYVISAFDRGNTRTGSNLPTDKENGYLSTVAANAGRIFYAGVLSSVTDGDDLSPNYTGTVFFSKVVDNPEVLGTCYQEADPTSEHIYDLVDTDGGYIPIPEASNILKLVSSGQSVLVIAENGVWEIFGGERGFLATEYQVSKITNIGCLCAESVVEAEDRVFYWSQGGLYVLSKEQISGQFSSSNITETTIQSLYNDIPSVASQNVKGHYDPISKKVSWLYNDDDDYDGVELKNKYTKELVLDLVINAFYKNVLAEIDTYSPFVAGYVETPNFNTISVQQEVVVNGEQVQVNGEDVVVTTQQRGRGTSVTKYLTFIPSASTYSFTLSAYSSREFKDWVTADSAGANYSSYLVTGLELAGDAVRRKQAPYIFFYFQRTEDGYVIDGDDVSLDNQSSCKVRSRWDFSDSDNSGKWGAEFQAYRLQRNYIPASSSDTFDYGHDVIVTKNKLRGRGRSVSLYIASEEGKDMHLLGWATVVNVEGRG